MPIGINLRNPLPFEAECSFVESRYPDSVDNSMRLDPVYMTFLI